MLNSSLRSALLCVAFTLIVVARGAAATCAWSLEEVLPNVAITRVRDAGGRVVHLAFVDETRPELTSTAMLVGAEVFFNHQLGNPSGRPRALFGRDVVRVALLEFGDRVRAVRGVWLSGVNLETFLELTTRGWSDDAAALATWTGRRAAEHGFTRPRQLYPNGDRRVPNYVRYNFERP